MNSRLAQLHTHLLDLAQMHGGFLPFDKFMEAALYTPALGYYTATRPVGSAASGADFTTAPEISDLFGQTLAQAIAPCFSDGLPVHVLECGAGTGKLAKDILDGLATLGLLVKSYAILELSASLRAQQQLLLAAYPCVVWLDNLPEAGTFTGVVLANELLDALPVRAFVLEYGVVFERGVVWNEITSSWNWVQRPANTEDAHAVLLSLSENIENIKNQPRYELERGEQASAWVNSVAACIQCGAMVLIDYGFSCPELYHPQRNGGTLMAHRLHQATPNVLAHIGDADITVHVNFTAVVQAAIAQGMELVGFLNQARFLINAGIAQTFAKATVALGSVDVVAQAQLSRGMQVLMSEAEMGELFKVIAFTRDCPTPLGFERGDRSFRLLPES